MFFSSHEIDEDEIAAEKIKSTFQIMGFSVNPDKMPKGQLLYRKRLSKLRPPRSKRFGVAKKTYFDDEGNPCQVIFIKWSQKKISKIMMTIIS